MSGYIRLSFVAAVLLLGLPALVFAQAATQPVTVTANEPVVAEVAGPMLPAGETPVLPAAATQPGTQPATMPAVAAGTATTRPVEPYRGSIEKTAIRGGGAAAGDVPATQEAAGKALTLSWGQSGIGTAVQVGGALCIVIGLIFVGRAMAKRWVPGAAAASGKNVIEILARYPLAKAQSLVMVRIGSQIVVLNQTREASSSILVISDPNEVVSIMGQIQGGKPNSVQAGFTKLLANAQMDLERGGPEQGDMSDAIEARMSANHVMEEEQLEEQLDEMAAAKRQLMELRQQVRTIRENLK